MLLEIRLDTSKERRHHSAYDRVQAILEAFDSIAPKVQVGIKLKLIQAVGQFASESRNAERMRLCRVRIG